MSIVHPLSAASRPEIIEHLVALPPEDRRLRFGAPSADEGIARYVRGIDFEHDTVFGIRDEANVLVGVTHVAQLDDAVELGLSVHPSRRGEGLAQTMFQRAALHARNRGIAELYMHCLSENAAMMHIARKSGMRIVIDGSDRDAWLALPPATPMSVGEEIRQQQLVLLDWTVRSVVRATRERPLMAASRRLESASIH